jgi:hypothetical protein
MAVLLQEWRKFPPYVEINVEIGTPRSKPYFSFGNSGNSGSGIQWVTHLFQYSSFVSSGS